MYLVSEAAGLVGARRARGAVDHVELAVLPAADAEQEAEDIALLALLQLGEVFVRAHVDCGFRMVSSRVEGKASRAKGRGGWASWRGTLEVEEAKDGDNVGRGIGEIGSRSESVCEVDSSCYTAAQRCRGRGWRGEGKFAARWAARVEGSGRRGSKAGCQYWFARVRSSARTRTSSAALKRTRGESVSAALVPWRPPLTPLNSPTTAPFLSLQRLDVL